MLDVDGDQLLRCDSIDDLGIILPIKKTNTIHIILRQVKWLSLGVAIIFVIIFGFGKQARLWIYKLNIIAELSKHLGLPRRGDYVGPRCLVKVACLQKLAHAEYCQSVRGTAGVLAVDDDVLVHAQGTIFLNSPLKVVKVV
jgi:hypothetical protein